MFHEMIEKPLKCGKSLNYSNRNWHILSTYYPWNKCSKHLHHHRRRYHLHEEYFRVLRARKWRKRYFVFNYRYLLFARIHTHTLTYHAIAFVIWYELAQRLLSFVIGCLPFGGYGRLFVRQIPSYEMGWKFSVRVCKFMCVCALN